MIVAAGKQYRSRRGERVLVTEVESSGFWPVHFVVMDGRYKGVGARDGSRLTIDGRATEPVDGVFSDHLNDLVAEWLDECNIASIFPVPDEILQLEHERYLGEIPPLLTLSAFHRNVRL